ncbi:putative O-glycosylation ligase, exosortase A system-associated [Aurantiacibacter aquimixticola]|uniref:Putative O-glycosylation ligase, exosortase A system-associated n=1 Tax=Aurantiacibacter aquimixticola TaxID=1958945 RepID=A0A419RUH7_9SPHN|nr:putative O-glycosylation ligase, exosortase A system-associated [Aurantiacibacter aquimixticola]RJY09432.1 putative O-glycosylation ligase, exosortase A system-associated [Aurantiacibacter aquimixticola]
MRDLVLLAFVAAVIAMGFKRPFLWVLLYIYVDIVSPQLIGWGVIRSLSLSLVTFIAAFAGYVLLDSKEGSRFTLRQALIVALLAWCGYTTLGAVFQDSAWEKWSWVWKSMFFGAFLPLTLRTRLRLESAVLIFALSIAAIAINGGIKTAFGGGGYGTLTLLVDENSGIYEGSIISTAAIATIPLILFLAKRGTIFAPGRAVWIFALATIFACLLIPVGTGARTGLVCIGVLGVLMLRQVRHRFMFAGLAGGALVASIPFLPAEYTERMSTITGFRSDESASTRLEVWKWTYHYALANPAGGGFDAYRENSFTYEMPQIEGDGNNRRITYQEVTDEARAYHSSYFEMLGEQGWIGLGLWLALHGLGLWQMERIRRRERPGQADRDEWMFDLATTLQHAQVIFLVGAAFVGIAYQSFIFLLIAMQCALWSQWKQDRHGFAPSPVAEKLAASRQPVAG